MPKSPEQNLMHHDEAENEAHLFNERKQKVLEIIKAIRDLVTNERSKGTVGAAQELVANKDIVIDFITDYYTDNGLEAQRELFGKESEEAKKAAEDRDRVIDEWFNRGVTSFEQIRYLRLRSLVDNSSLEVGYAWIKGSGEGYGKALNSVERFRIRADEFDTENIGNNGFASRVSLEDIYDPIEKGVQSKKII